LILVISNIANEAAATLVDMFPPGAAALVTASQFHQSFKGGICVNDFSASRVRLNNTAVSVPGITGVITTIANFYSQEFYYIQAADREYVCTEMNAFFLYFLSELNCKKINPPSIRSFAGISIYKTEWIKIAHTLDIPVWPARIINAKPVDTENLSGLTLYSCTVIGDAIISEKMPEAVCRYTRNLQQAFSIPYLTCYFIEKNSSEYYLADIASVPDISIPANRDAIVNYFS
jgi:hypothetical protein